MHPNVVPDAQTIGQYRGTRRAFLAALPGSTHRPLDPAYQKQLALRTQRAHALVRQAMQRRGRLVPTRVRRVLALAVTHVTPED